MTAKPAIAVTGGIAEGKSTVLDMMAAYGLRTLSADAVVDDMWRDPDFLGRLANVPALEGASSRDEVRRIVLEKPSARLALNRLTHPEVLRRLFSADVDAAEIPLLIEACLIDAFSQIWVVTCGEHEQRRRLIQRVGPEKTDLLLATQLPTRAKLPFADIIVRTDEPMERVHSFVNKTLQER